MDANSTQQAAFQTATGFSMSDLSTLIASIVVVAIFLWSAWVTQSLYMQWANRNNNGQVSLFDVMVAAVRSIVILLLIIAFI